MLPKIVLEELFSQLDHHQVYTLRLVCLDFYQAAFPLLLRVHSLKQTQDVNYQHFLKKNGKHVKGLIIRMHTCHELLASGLSLHSTFPHLRSLLFDFRYSSTVQCEALVKDCLRLKNLKHLGLVGYNPGGYEACFPLFEMLESIYVMFYPNNLLKNQQLCKNLKKLIFGYCKSDLWQELIQDSAKVSCKVVYAGSSEVRFPLKAESNDYGWVHYTIDNCDDFFFRMPLGQGSKKHVNTFDLPNNLQYNPKMLNEQEAIETLKIPNLVDHFILRTFKSYSGPWPPLEEYLQRIPSVQFSYDLWFLYRKSPVWQATKVCFENIECQEEFFGMIEVCFPNLRNLFINSSFAPEVIPLLKGSLSKLIHFSSEAPQPEHFWVKLLELAPNLQYIHTNHVPPHVLDIQNQRHFLAFLPYQNIHGNSGDLYDFSDFNKHLFS
ncbi:hypothetical protein DSO57_1001932 [Entomophthora muscae]|uniref:Uncharacterized protein n=1 Tax=Entomophthora muscae TaxID=34485 RepID=A0ACC2UTN0_9FUNG|nr:hypothetical protein DSO57_1001932 [Entomophthora muscae]